MNIIKIIFVILMFIPIVLYKKFKDLDIVSKYQCGIIFMVGMITVIGWNAYGIFEKGTAWKSKYSTAMLMVKDLNKSVNELKEKNVKKDRYIVELEKKKDVRNRNKTELTHATLSNQNNNLLNVKACGQKWQGGLGTDKHDHVKFSSYEYSIRAGAKVLFKYMEEHKISTINGIVKRFSTNNHKAYAAYLSKHMHLGKDEKFNLVKRLPELLQYMSEFETGEKVNHKYFVAYDVTAQVETNRQAKIARLEKENEELKKKVKELEKKDKKTEVASK